MKKRVLHTLLALAGCFFAIFVSPAQAVSPDKTPTAAYWALSDANQPTHPETSGALRTLMISIVVLIVIGTLAIYASKKWLPKICLAKGKHISVLENVQLAPHRAIHLVQVGSQRFLVGSSNESVRMLADVTLALTDEVSEKDE